ncbi:acetylxylan esterase [Edaphobacter acidisoli]|uniref:Acetylxylan esterase n=1 Tax=Edaphobacter acidisoli TaxID=2040573 RepID=A0A916W6L1_9BACT|nr:acetylxylan esterase [Edaphobacter acidisoli]
MALAGCSCATLAQTASRKPPVTFTAEQDHQDMMEQLGIVALRPGPSGDENAPNHANYDESKANPYPELPDVLALNDGRKVTTAEMWWKLRRPEIVEDFEREVYGRIPKHTPKVTWTVAVTDHEYVGFTPVIAKRLVGHVDNSSCPQIHVDIQMTLVVPANAKGPVPVLMMFGQSVLPNPTQPPVEDVEKINAKLKELLAKDDPEIAEIFKKYPGYDPVPAKLLSFPTRLNPGEDRPPHEELLADGWGYAMIDPASIQADNGAGLTRGIIGLVNHGQPRRPDDWGSLRAWEWGAARGLDYLETDPAVDAKHVGIEGVSRYGKAALVTLAFEPRFYMGLIGSSGKGGTTLLRRNFGEAVENLASSGEYHWMAGNFIKYAAASLKSGARPLNPGDLPVDSHELIALCAPRLVFVSYGVPEQGDAKWLDHEGSYMAAVAAGPVFRLLGVKGLSSNGQSLGDDYKTAKMPPVLDGLLDGELAWRQDAGGHTDAPNVKYFIMWADGKMGRETRLK